MAARASLPPLWICLTLLCLSAQPLPQPRGRPWLGSSIPISPATAPPPGRNELKKKNEKKKRERNDNNKKSLPATFSLARLISQGVKALWVGDCGNGSRAGEMSACKVVRSRSRYYRGGIGQPQSRVCLMKLRGSSRFYLTCPLPARFCGSHPPTTRLGVITVRASVFCY